MDVVAGEEEHSSPLAEVEHDFRAAVMEGQVEAHSGFDCDPVVGR